MKVENRDGNVCKISKEDYQEIQSEEGSSASSVKAIFFLIHKPVISTKKNI